MEEKQKIQNPIKKNWTLIETLLIAGRMMAAGSFIDYQIFRLVTQL